MWKCSLLIALCTLTRFVVPEEVLALRPFVTTDADVVETNLIEVEYGIFGLHVQNIQAMMNLHWNRRVFVSIMGYYGIARLYWKPWVS
ncbi:MAG: hypothetical protein HYV59_06635 [Planctomycetes bacterium]|nr:hypothetical protein [Planctomycetota bacterium]